VPATPTTHLNADFGALSGAFPIDADVLPTAAEVHDEGIAVAKSNLETELRRLREIGATADGAVGDQDPMRQVHGEPARNPWWQGREDDFVELLLGDRLLDRDHRVGVANGAVGSRADLAESAQFGVQIGSGHGNAFVADLGRGGKDGRIDGEGATERAEVGGQRRDGGRRCEDPEFSGSARHPITDGVQQFLSAKRLIRYDKVSMHSWASGLSVEPPATAQWPGSIAAAQVGHQHDLVRLRLGNCYREIRLGATILLL